MINKIRFKNYKSFKDYQELELKPMTIIIGKNSSGKSAVTKLPVLIDNSFNNVIGEPFTMDYDGVQFGDDYRDLFYGRIPNAVLEFEMTSAQNNVLNIKIVSDFEKNTIPNIYSWRLNNTGDFNYSASTNNYKDAVDGKEYLLTFEGFNLDEIRNADGSETDRHLWLNDIRMRTDYIGPFRVYANSMRTFQLRTFRAIDKVGVDGTDAYYILGIDSLKSEGKLVKADSSTTPFQRKSGVFVLISGIFTPPISVIMCSKSTSAKRGELKKPRLLCKVSTKQIKEQPVSLAI